MVAAAIYLLTLFTAAQGQPTRQDLFVKSFSPWGIIRLDGQTGAVVYSVPAIGYYLTPSPDGFLWAAGAKYDPATGSQVQTSFRVPLLGIDFGPDGNLYAGSGSEIRRFNGETGAPLAGFIVRAGSEGVQDIEALRFGPDGNLYLTERSGRRVMRYSGNTGEFIDVFASDSHLVNARSLEWGPNGNLFVASLGNALNRGSIVEFDGVTGDFLRVFADDIDGANGLALGPDGNLYVGSELSGTVRRYDMSSGAYIDDFATGLPTSIVGMAWVNVAVPEPTAAGLAALAIAAASHRRRDDIDHR